MRALLSTTAWFLLAGIAIAGEGEIYFAPDTPYYFDHFHPEQKPWQPGDGLNFEEVFKNYQYYEIRFLNKNQEIQVTHYIQGRSEGSERYRINHDRMLEKLRQ